MTDSLTKEDCVNILTKFLETDDFHLNSFKIVDFHNPLQGLVGEHFTLKVEYKKNEKTQCQEFFLKTLSKNPLMVTFSKELLVYEKEAFFYGLLAEFEKFQIPAEFAPNCFFSKPYVVVLEDLSEEYTGTPKRQCLNYEQCVACLRVVAQFHASSIIYEKKKEEELGRKFSLYKDNSKILEDRFLSEDAKLAKKWMECAILALFSLIDLLPETKISNEDFKNKFGEILQFEGGPEGLVNAILHGDLWTSNFMYSKNNDVKLLDFQIISYGPIEKDLLEFFMLSTTRQFRTENFDELLKYYYKELSQNLAGANLSDILPPLSKFVESCENFVLPAKIRATVDHSYTFLEDRIYEEVLKSVESYKKFLFEDRGKYISDAFSKSTDFKKMLEEDLVELRDLLFSS